MIPLNKNLDMLVYDDLVYNWTCDLKIIGMLETLSEKIRGTPRISGLDETKATL